jgi:hypothetical protein
LKPDFVEIITWNGKLSTMQKKEKKKKGNLYGWDVYSLNLCNS